MVIALELLVAETLVGVSFVVRRASLESGLDQSRVAFQESEGIYPQTD